MAEQLSYLHYPKPFKNPNYTKNVNRRAKNLKAVLGSERERERTEREKRRQEREEKMDVDGENAEEQTEEDLPTCKLSHRDSDILKCLTLVLDATIEAPPSVLPQRKYCDITGLEVCCNLSFEAYEFTSFTGTVYRSRHRTALS